MRVVRTHGADRKVASTQQFGFSGPTARAQTIHAFEHVDAPARVMPVLLALPLEQLLHCFGHLPALDEIEPGQDGPGGTEAEVFDQLLAQVSFRRGVDNQCALAREADYAVLGVELHQFADAQVFDGDASSFVLIEPALF